MMLVKQAAWAQGGKSAKAGATAAAVNPTFPAEQKIQEEEVRSTGGLLEIITRAGWFGVFIWLLLLACSVGCVALVVDSLITIRPVRVSPLELADKVRAAIAQGDLLKAINECEVTPCPLSTILTAGFANVQEGYEVVQDSVSIAADQEAERMLQRVTYLSVISNTGPMLGLIGTVQGMIFAFFTLGTMQAGAAQQAMLAINISHGLWATAVGLSVAVIATIFYFFFKNKAMRLILNMEALTLDLTKTLRNVEVVEA
jgi:biopolymer transport protein ExbB